MNINTRINVTKRNGTSEPLDLEKIHRVLEWAAKGLDVSISLVELNAHIQFFEGIATEDVHETIIKSAADLISVETPDYQYLAARLHIFHLRKKAFSQYKPPSLVTHVAKMVDMGKYDADILVKYTTEELNTLDTFIDHNRDLNYVYAATKQLEGKYLVQDRTTGEIFESPQFCNMLIGATLFAEYPEKTRLTYVKEFYDAVSLFEISLPTPIMGGVRTPTRQFSSCVLIEVGDSLNSINAAASSIVKYVSQRAGIGLNAGRIRAVGSRIRGGEAEHTGVIPFFKYFQTAVKSCSQGGIRGGAATLFYPAWHLEVESMLVLKNNRGVEENRVRQLDYCIQLHKVMYARLIQGKNITLFSPSDVPGLYDAYFSCPVEFERLYLKYEADPSIRKKTIKAVELFSSLMQERASTGRIYVQNVDHCNTHSPFNPELAPIRQSNLCLEIALPTKPLDNILDPEGEIALCTLSAINVGIVTDPKRIEVLSDLIVRALDALLDYQDYPMPAAEKSSKERRTLGVGVIGFAHRLAKEGVRYSDGSAINITHDIFETLQYSLLKASNNLAKEQGACAAFGDTTYSQGILPIDTYKSDVDKLHPATYNHDWEALRADIGKYGLRNSTLTALMPSETSSQISNATNGIEPPRELMSVKASKDGILRQIVPDFATLGDAYECLWDIPGNDGYLQLVAIMQKFVDQAISANTKYDPSKYPEGKVPMQLLLKDLVTAYRLGLKTLYYHNTRDGADSTETVQKDSGCDGGACKI